MMMKMSVHKTFVLCLLAFAFAGCNSMTEKASKDLRPRAFYQVPSDRLAYRLETDVDFDAPAPAVEKTEAIQKDFDTKRLNDALLRTVTSPDGLRVLALYAASDTPEGDFRLDEYSADGTNPHPIMPSNLTGTFPQSVIWSPDGQFIAFIGYRTGSAEDEANAGKKSAKKKGAKDDLLNAPAVKPDTNPAAPTAPLLPPVAAFKTEQIYICNRDGGDLKPLTSREGLIYFAIAWSPQSVAIAALACKESEWNTRRAENRAPAGRPRLITLDGGERLLDDRLTDVTPVWSPDGAKLATAFDTDIAIYDAGATAIANAPTSADAPLQDELLAASVKYDATKLKKSDDNATNKNAANKDANTDANKNAANNEATNATSSNSTSLSFNPIVRLEWKKSDALLLETGFVRVYKGGEPVSNYLRWHALYLSPQTALVEKKSGV